MRLEDRFRGLDWAHQSGIITQVLYTDDTTIAGVEGEEANHFAATVDLVLQKASRASDPQPCELFFHSEPTTLDRWVRNYDLHNLMLRFHKQDDISVAQAYHQGSLLLGENPIVAVQGNSFLESYEALKGIITDDFIDHYVAQEFEQMRQG